MFLNFEIKAVLLVHVHPSCFILRNVLKFC
jgi:hypothetical protein